ncbi:Rne/Rng family ribonuclease [Alterinioella nitratireducens]|uniref:Rne/Rng family ribonuclease n=1 Tax=Alterinioella nitratireducens TaxID=2735915 RepID=UPI001555EE77|nr:ribonuclease E/G [Alterinioella nitratireducens]NPD18355.1 Rne/Rng family ribonuclease [Alterinioella nitratireducens]
MAKKMLIDATHAEETRVVVADGNKVEEFDFESLNKRQLAGNIYLAKITRVEPSLQAAFVDYGGNRHGFLAFSEIHPDYYQIPTADREALLAEERAYAEAQAAAEADADAKPKRSRRRRKKPADAQAGTANETVAADSNDDAVTSGDAEDASATPSSMDVVDLDADEGGPELIGDESDDNGDDTAKPADEAKDPNISTVADDDDQEDIRPVRKPRPRRYKIQEVVKVRQVMLVQVVKEERGNKGAALTTYLSLAGRYCVLMPNTARGGGISRKITTAADRKKLKDIANSLEVPQGAGLIIRTAGAKRTKTEIKRDYEYLQRQWEQVRDLTLKSIAPAAIYQEGDLIHRSIRDLYNRDIDEVLVEGEAGYRHAKNFMKMIMPSHAKNVKQYTDQMPLFARHQVEGYLADMFNPTVQLKSGGYIVIGVTEALIAIDVNSGRSTKEGSIEDTATKTNLEASDEIARQLRLRDLAGLIVIDYIDMDERRNNAAVEKRLKDKLKSDRARIQVGRISGFGLLEMSRQRLRPGMLEATTQPCHACHGTGIVRSDDSLALSILRQLEEEGTRRRSREVLLTVPIGILNFIMNTKREYLAAIEARYGLSIRVEGDPMLVSPDYKIEKFKTATRRVPAEAPVISMDSALMEEVANEASDEDSAPVVDSPAEIAANAGEEAPKKKRRRRRGGRGRRKSDTGNGENGNTENGNGDNGTAEAATSDDAAKPDAEVTEAPAAEAEALADAPVAETPAEEEAPKPKRKRASRAKKKPVEEAPAEEAQPEEAQAPAAEEAQPEEAPAETAAEEAPQPVPEEAAPVEEAQGAEETPEQPEPEPERTPEPAMAEETPADDPDRPKKRGWWSLG